MFKNIKIGTSPKQFVLLAVGADRKVPPHAYRSNSGAKDALKHALFTGSMGEIVAGPGQFVLVGLGKKEARTPLAFRTLGARLLAALDKAKIDSVLIVSDELNAAQGQSIAEGMGLAQWRFDDHRGTASRAKEPKGVLTVEGGDSDLHKSFIRGLALAQSINVARQFAATPPNVCRPNWVGSEAKRMARQSSLRCRVIDVAQAKKLGMGGLVAVGQGSSVPPCLVVIEHRPTRARGGHLVLVGKTITYDTGGYSLKVNNGMVGMKYDKCGGAAVLGAMHAIAAQKLPIRVTAILAVAENMVSDDAYRPDDIITLHNGVTVEVTNTDAEGRLVLADALAYATSTLKPDYIVDVATLTGGVVVALGAFCAGLFCENDGFRASVESAAARTDERVWRLPLWSEHRDFMRSRHADILNSNPARQAYPIQGAAFLSYFVDEKTPWAHIDIAGVASKENAGSSPTGVGPTGYGVKLLTELATSLAG
ncbi:MAG: leucyl aminopeptidase family protein [Planctomycetota bacterium]|nr:leucyl aminopeptidase family protein [Planctomycetota bacterium]